LPKVFRDKMNLQAGDKLNFVMLDNGVMQVIPLKQSVTKRRGMVPAPEKSVTIEEMNQAIAQRASRK
ncbi:MAG: AbrB/MazE/SpoVT family DNA-binding domain-containing protein, partial [Lentisphaeraceae bacterium]|nr:AbrB/MazE/SpoVT family DNA-binding domain-containing protein [Lentisphaeraceae bacterium]